jgi:hypothetical protein
MDRTDRRPRSGGRGRVAPACPGVKLESTPPVVTTSATVKFTEASLSTKVIMGEFVFSVQERVNAVTS